MKVAIIVSDFNEDITSRMVKKAEEGIKSAGGTVSKILHVPGAFEIPFAAQKALETSDAAVTLGVVLEGKTAHDIVIVEAIAPKLLDISLQKNKAIGFGVIGPRVSKKEAEERAEEYAKRAVETVFAVSKL